MTRMLGASQPNFLQPVMCHLREVAPLGDFLVRFHEPRVNVVVTLRDSLAVPEGLETVSDLPTMVQRGMGDRSSVNSD